MCNDLAKIYLIYESREDWMNRYKYIHNKEFFSRFLASEKEVDKIYTILKSYNFDVEIIKYPYYSIKQINEIISKEVKSIVWNLTDGYENYIGAHVPSFINFFNKPYIGSSTFVQILCQNKHFTKSILDDSGIKTPQWISGKKSFYQSIEDDVQLTYPLFIKPTKYDNSIGTEFIEPIAYNRIEMFAKINILFNAGIDDVLVEEFIDGKEITIAAIHVNNWNILPLERHYDGKYISSYAKDNEKGFLKNQTILLDQSLIDLGKKVIEVLDIKDYCRIDIRIKNNKAYVLEVNSATFLTTTSFEKLSKEFFGDTQKMFYELIMNSYNRQTS